MNITVGNLQASEREPTDYREVQGTRIAHEICCSEGVKRLDGRRGKTSVRLSSAFRFGKMCCFEAHLS
jgi:hypothetical protein